MAYRNMEFIEAPAFTREYKAGGNDNGEA